VCFLLLLPHRIINIIAASVSVVPGFLLPGTGIWYYLVLQGGLYTSFSEIGFYCSAVRPPPDVVSGYTKVSKQEILLFERIFVLKVREKALIICDGP
jgi:hypothetical protein